MQEEIKFKECLCPIPSCKHRVLPANTSIYICLYNVPEEDREAYVDSLREYVKTLSFNRRYGGVI